jgi:hypothetical protein
MRILFLYIALWLPYQLAQLLVCFVGQKRMPFITKKYPVQGISFIRKRTMVFDEPHIPDQTVTPVDLYAAVV